LGSLWTPSALAGTYTWQLPSAANPGPSNPDQDAYGGAPWTYVDGAALASATPTSFRNLTTYSTSIDGALTGWYDAGDSDNPFVAVNRTQASVGGVPPGQLALQPARDRAVAIGWTSPLTSAQTVAVDGTFTPDSQGICASQPTWKLEQDGTVIASGGSATGSTGQAINASPTVAPGDTLYLIVGFTGLYDAQCDTAGVSLSIQAPSAPPAVSLSSPQASQTISGAQPTFSGAAGSDFGDSATVTVRVWSGQTATGNPVETLSTQRSGAGYSVTASPPLANGIYTARSEQDDQAGDVGLSDQVTFTVHNIAPAVSLARLSVKPLITSTPVLKGTAGVASGDSALVGIAVWSGASIQGSAIRYLVAKRSADGSWSVRVTPGLADGRYTAEAAQEGAGSIIGVSRPETFVIKVHPPAVTIDQPAARASLRAGGTFPLFGHGGQAIGDSSHVSVSMYRGRRARGRPAVSFTAAVRGGRWSRRLRSFPRPGTYTIVVLQRDDAGHTGRVTQTFTILPPPKVIAGPPQLDRADQASIPIMCTASSGSCTGQVLVETVRAFSPVSGGPRGPVRVLFGYVDEPAGATSVIRARVAAYVAAALRRAGTVRVRITVKLTGSAGQVISAAGLSVLRLTR